MRSFYAAAELWRADVEKTKREKTRRSSHGISVCQLLLVAPELIKRHIARADLLKLCDERAKLSASTANRDLEAIKACLEWCWINELEVPPVQLARLLLPIPPKRDRTLQPEQLERLFAAAALCLPILVVLRICYGTGLRLGEVLALQWSDIDEERGSLRVEPKPYWIPKTPAAVREVHAPELVTWLVSVRRTMRYRGAEARVCQMDPARGKPWTHRIHARLKDTFDRAGIVGTQKSHALRHTLASDLVQSGAPIHVAQKMLGHSSPSTTLGIYAHAQRSGIEAAGKALEKWRRGRS